ncbi:MAG: winged helix-turn-helix transcriptional regulator [Tenericutes bacterium]|nr:winged helix-turn-helix transcriptional regulator [Mycoplasmatota bacterium]
MHNTFKVLGDVNRLRIINLLLYEKLCVCEIEESLKMQQTTVSRLLAKLKTINILHSERNAQWIYYSVSKQFIKENKYLIKYFEEKFDEDHVYKEDLLRFNKIKERCTTDTCCK